MARGIESIFDLGFAARNRSFSGALVEVVFSRRGSTQSLENGIWGDLGLPFHLFLLDFFQVWRNECGICSVESDFYSVPPRAGI